MVHTTIVLITIDHLCSSTVPLKIPAEVTAMIRGVKFVSIPVADQERALKFYTEVLGFRLLTDQPFDDEQRWIELGISGADTRVVLFRFGDELKPGGMVNLALWSDNVEDTARELKAKGVEFVMEPKKEHWGTTSVFKDIDGNVIVLSSH
jgi:catechol 2,3-dioxygenase-like lactoylglutathione lyase family enzyme